MCLVRPFYDYSRGRRFYYIFVVGGVELIDATHRVKVYKNTFRNDAYDPESKKGPTSGAPRKAGIGRDISESTTHIGKQTFDGAQSDICFTRFKEPFCIF